MSWDCSPGTRPPGRVRSSPTSSRTPWTTSATASATPVTTRCSPNPTAPSVGESVPGPDELEWQATSSGSLFRLVLTDQRINDEPPEQAISTLLSLGFHFEPAQVHEWGVDPRLRRQHPARRAAPGPRLPLPAGRQVPAGRLLLHHPPAPVPPPAAPRAGPGHQPGRVPGATSRQAPGSRSSPTPTASRWCGPSGPGRRSTSAAELAATFETPFGTFMLIRYRYELDDLGVTGWRVMAYRGDVQVMLACGQDARRSSEVEDANQDRLEWIQGLFDYFQTATFSTQQFVLDAGTEYRVLADWSWTGEHRLGGGPTPERNVTQEFRFTTAPAAGPDQQRDHPGAGRVRPAAPCPGTCWPSRPWTTRRPSWTTRCASTSASGTSPSCSTATDATSDGGAPHRRARPPGGRGRRRPEPALRGGLLPEADRRR